MPKKQKKKKIADPTETIALRRIVVSDEEIDDDGILMQQEEKEEDEEGSPLLDIDESFLPDDTQQRIDVSESDATDTWNQLHKNFLHSMSNSPQMVRLNVGGCFYSTSLSTLCSRGGMLSAMFSGRYSPFKDEDGCYFIDRDGTHFRYILNYLRDGFVRLPKNLQTLQELMVESQYYQIPGLIKEICEAPRLSKDEYLTIRYLPANTYDGWPIRIEGPLEEHIICELNGGSRPPARETTEVKNMYGQPSTGWKVRGLFLTKIFNILASYGWKLRTSNGSGGGKQRNFAEMYVFCRSKLLRRQRRNNNNKAKRRSESYSYSHLFSFLNADGLIGEEEYGLPPTEPPPIDIDIKIDL